MAGILGKAKEKVVAYKTDDPNEVLGSNTRSELADLDAQIRTAKRRQLMAAGVTIFSPETCIIDTDVEIGADTVLEPFVQILGNTRIGADCRIRSYTVINNSALGDGVLVRPGCILDEARVADGAVLGPYSHLRPGSEIGEGAYVAARSSITDDGPADALALGRSRQIVKEGWAKQKRQQKKQ